MTIRDPVSRFESAYKWMKNEASESKRKIFDCYPSLSDLGEHCLEDTPCAKLLAHELMLDQSVGHMGMGIEYYLQDIVLDNYRENVHVIQNERLADDFNDAISDILGIRVNITMPREHSQYPGSEDFLPLEYHANVKQLLERNYEVYNEIKRNYTVNWSRIPMTITARCECDVFLFISWNENSEHSITWQYRVTTRLMLDYQVSGVQLIDFCFDSIIVLVISSNERDLVSGTLQ